MYGEYASNWAYAEQQNTSAVPCKLYDGADHEVAVVNNHKVPTLFVDGIQVSIIVSGDDGGEAAAAGKLLYSPTKADLTPEPMTYRGGSYNDFVWQGTVSHLLISLTPFTASEVLQLHSQQGRL